MRIIEPSVELVGGNVGLFDRPKHVELCGRVCYKSESKITEDSAEKFIAGIIKRGHEAVLEHARITLSLSNHQDTYKLLMRVCAGMRKIGLYDYLTFTRRDNKYDTYVVSGNIRAWRGVFSFMFRNDYPFTNVLKRTWAENAPFFPEFFNPDAPYIPDTITDINPSPNMPLFDDPALRMRHSWYTLRFICDRGVTHEIVRHRPASYCQESTRYCNYSKADFGGEITVIEPYYLRDDVTAYNAWKRGCEAAETAYFDLLNADRTAQEARCVLPNSLKTELVMTATADEWLHFLKLRTAEAAHPQMREVATRAKEILAGQDAEVFSDEQIRNAQ